MEKLDATKPQESQREVAFVNGVIQRCQNDKGQAARLSRADNPSTEQQSWEFLGAWHIDLTNDDQRLAYATVAAAIARTKPKADGSLSLGQAIAMCYAEGHESDQAKAKMRRLLSCDGLAELCRMLRPALRLVESRTTQPLDYAKLLLQLVQFGKAARSGNDEWRQRIMAQWAQEFYNHQASV